MTIKDLYSEEVSDFMFGGAKHPFYAMLAIIWMIWMFVTLAASFLSWSISFWGFRIFIIFLILHWGSLVLAYYNKPKWKELS